MRFTDIMRFREKAYERAEELGLQDDEADAYVNTEWDNLCDYRREEAEEREEERLLRKHFGD